MTPVNLHLLGSPHLEQSEQVISLHRRRRSIALLAYLVMTAQPHSRERLATLLWPEQTPEQARANLRRDLSFLKRQLGDNLITADREQIALNRETPLCVDAQLFVEKVTAVQQHNHLADLPCAACTAALTDAVALYRDDFMAGYTLPDSTEFDEWQFFQRERLRQKLAIGLQQLITRLQAEGAFEEAVVYGRRWLALDPLQEPVHRLLMQLYAQAGQQTAALQQYERCRDLLQQELGVAPEPETTALYEAIKTRQRSFAADLLPALKATEPATEEATIVEVADETSGQAAPTLPLLPTPFIGRAREIKEISQLLQKGYGRLCTLIGPGGIGKTRLALQVAATVTNLYTAVHFVPLASVTTVEGVVTAIAEKVQCRLNGAEPPLQQLLACVGHKKLLLVLDNFEHLLAAANVVVELLHRAPQLTLLVTSRERLNLSEETVYAVTGLALPDAAGAPGASQTDAVALLRQRVRMIRPEFTFTPQDEEALFRICRLVQGMPLAIVLAASWLDMFSLEQIAAEISHNLGFLATEMRDIPARQRSMRAVFAASWKQLAPEEQQMFMKLSVFCGGFTREAAQAVTGGRLRQLRQLINKSFVAVGDHGRYELHELLRQFAAEQLACFPEEMVSTRNAHCAFFANFLQEQTQYLLGGQQRRGLTAVNREYDNVWSAWQWAIQENRLAEIQQALRPWELYCQFQSCYLEGVKIYEVAYQKLHQQEPSPERDRTLAELLVYWGWLLIRVGRLDEAEALLQRCQSLYGQAGQLPVPGYASDPAIPLSLLATMRGDYATAVTLAEQAVRANSPESHIANLYNAYYVLTSATLAQGDYARAQQYAHQAYTLTRRANDRWFTAYVLIEMGKIALAQDDLATAQKHFQASYQLRQEIEDPEGMAIALVYSGQVLLRKQAYAEAQSSFEQSLGIYQEIDDKGGLARTYQGLGQIACAQGKYETARYALHQALLLAAEMNFVPLFFSILSAMASLFMAVEQWESSYALFSFVSQQPKADHATRTEAEKQLRHFAPFTEADNHTLAIPSPGLTLADVFYLMEPF
ncbi:MAG: tetratricopeptide repeat protein [Anaerolineaceae bacterium]|nr:tetratricopeptide repeat protein [Anaerolineaceae bacterium]